MKSNFKGPFLPIAWIAYFIIVFEIIYMVTPFLALSYYSFYAPSLNFLNNWNLTSWLTGFFLPHISETSSALLNSMSTLGRYLFLISFLAFIICAAQIYYTKLTKKGAVTSGLYKYIRHPQYAMFTLMGIGLLMIWPRFIMIVAFLLMLIIYFFLAKSEENECLSKYPTYKGYVDSTSMFIPGDNYVLSKLPDITSSGSRRILTIVAIFLGLNLLSISLAFLVREMSINNLYSVVNENSATISVAQIEDEIIVEIISIALSDDRVNSNIEKHDDGPWLNYVVPSAWFLADLPLEPYIEGLSGHTRPKDYDRSKYKVLFTKAIAHSEVNYEDIIKRTFMRIPILVVWVDLETKNVTKILEPPEHVVWGDIPTPLF